MPEIDDLPNGRDHDDDDIPSEWDIDNADLIDDISERMASGEIGVQFFSSESEMFQELPPTIMIAVPLATLAEWLGITEIDFLLNRFDDFEMRIGDAWE